MRTLVRDGLEMCCLLQPSQTIDDHEYPQVLRASGRNILKLKYFPIMLKQRMKAVKCPSDELAITNCALVNPEDFPSDTK